MGVEVHIPNASVCFVIPATPNKKASNYLNNVTNIRYKSVNAKVCHNEYTICFIHDLLINLNL